MATGGNGKEKGESSTEAYQELMEANSGTCAADYWAGPGINRPALDGKGLDGWKPAVSSSNAQLEKRVRDLERSIRRRESRKSDVKPKKSGKPKKDSPPGSPDGSSDSELSDSYTSGRESRSVSSSGSESLVCRSEKRIAKKKRTKYSRKCQLKDGKPVKNADKLKRIVTLLRRCYCKGKDVIGLINHLLVMSEKVESNFYKLDSLIGYDDECREAANELGIKAFREIQPESVLRFLRYDSTMAAKRQGSQASQSVIKKSGQKGYCFNQNTQTGCDSISCNFRHTCMFCGDSTHGSTGCKRGKGSSSRSSKGN